MKFKKAFLTLSLCFLLVFGVFGIIPSSVSAAENTQLTNLLIFIELSGDEGYFDAQKKEEILDFYNENVEGVKSYFDIMSKGKTSINTLEAGLYQEETLTISELQVKSETNTNGFMQTLENGKESVERVAREHTLLKRAAKEVLQNFSPENNPELDSNNDGQLDLVSFFISGEADINRSDILWPHKWQVYNNNLSSIYSNSYEDYSDLSITEKYNLDRTVKYGDIQFTHYVLYTESMISLGEASYSGSVLCHELFHAIDVLKGKNGETYGVNDLYRGFDEEIPVGVWDIMASTTKESLQSINAYYRQKLGWLTVGEEILDGKDDNNYTLVPATSPDGAVAVKFGEKNGQFFMAEYKKKTESGIDSGLFQSGIIIYRVNTKTGYAGNLGLADSYVPNEIEVLYDSTKLDAAKPDFLPAALTEGDFGSEIKYETDNTISYYIEKDSYLNSRIMLRNITANEDAITFTLDQTPELYEVKSTLMFDGQPLIEADVFVEGVKKGVTDENGGFTVSVTHGDILSFFKRGYEIAAIDTAAYELDLESENSITAPAVTAKTPIIFSASLSYKDNQIAEGLELKVFLNGSEITSYTNVEGLLTIADLFDTDTLRLACEGYTFSGSGSYSLSAYTGSLNLTVYANYSVTVRFVDEEGKTITNNGIEVYLNGEYTLTTNSGTFTLYNIAHGSTLSFLSKSYFYDNLTIEDNLTEAVLQGERKPGAVRLPTSIAVGMLVVFVLVFFYFIVIDSKKKSKYRRRRKR